MNAQTENRHNTAAINSADENQQNTSLMNATEENPQTAPTNAQETNVQATSPTTASKNQFNLETWTCNPAHHRTKMAIAMAKHASRTISTYTKMMDHWTRGMHLAASVYQRLQSRFKAEQYGRQVAEAKVDREYWIEKALALEIAYEHMGIEDTQE